MPPMRTRKSWAAVEDTQWEGAPVEGTWDVASWTKYAAGATLACTLMSTVCHCQLSIVAMKSTAHCRKLAAS